MAYIVVSNMFNRLETLNMQKSLDITNNTYKVLKRYSVFWSELPLKNIRSGECECNLHPALLYQGETFFSPKIKGESVRHGF